MSCRFNFDHECALRIARIFGRELSIRFDLPTWSNDHIVQLNRDMAHDTGEWEFEQAWSGYAMIRTNHIYDGLDHYRWSFRQTQIPSR